MLCAYSLCRKELLLSRFNRRKKFCGRRCQDLYYAEFRQCLRCKKKIESGIVCHDCRKPIWSPERMTPFDNLLGDRAKRVRIIKEQGVPHCEVCMLSIWMDRPIPLEIDHIDGDPENGKRENCRVICPNCHAQTDTYKGRNIGRVKAGRRAKTLKKYGNYRKER